MRSRFRESRPLDPTVPDGKPPEVAVLSRRIDSSWRISFLLRRPSCTLVFDCDRKICAT